jgi:hypothetical protein
MLSERPRWMEYKCQHRRFLARLSLTHTLFFHVIDDRNETDRIKIHLKKVYPKNLPLDLSFFFMVSAFHLKRTFQSVMLSFFRQSSVRIHLILCALFGSESYLFS